MNVFKLNLGLKNVHWLSIVRCRTLLDKVSIARAMYISDLLAYAEPAENQVEDVVARGRAGDFVERTQGVVEIE